MSQNPKPQHTTLVSLIDRLVKWRKDRREARKAAIAARWVQRGKEEADEYAWIDRSIAEQRAKDRALKRTKLIETMTCSIIAQRRGSRFDQLQQRDIEDCLLEATDYVDKLMDKSDPIPAPAHPANTPTRAYPEPENNWNAQ